METNGSSALAVYEQPRIALIPNEQTTNSAFALAKLAAASGLCKTKKPEDAFFVIMHGYEIGIPAMTALRTIHIINGVPVTSGEALLAIIRRSGKVDIKITGNATEATVWMKRRDSGEEYTAHWTIARATIAGLTGKQTWKNFPQAFLQWRGVGECSKFLCSDITNGLYAAEEIAPDLNYDESGELIEGQTITISKPVVEVNTTPAPFPETATRPVSIQPGKWVHECLDDGSCLDAFKALCKELNIITTDDHKPYLEALKITRYGEYDGKYVELDMQMRSIHERLNNPVADEPVTEPDPVAVASAAIPMDQAKTTLGSGGERRVDTSEPDAPVITAPDSPFAAPANPTPALSNSAFNRGLNTYQAQQAQAQVEYQNEELDTMFARQMERE